MRVAPRRARLVLVVRQCCGHLERVPCLVKTNKYLPSKLRWQVCKSVLVPQARPPPTRGLLLVVIQVANFLVEISSRARAFPTTKAISPNHPLSLVSCALHLHQQTLMLPGLSTVSSTGGASSTRNGASIPPVTAVRQPLRMHKETVTQVQLLEGTGSLATSEQFLPWLPTTKSDYSARRRRRARATASCIASNTT